LTPTGHTARFYRKAALDLAKRIIETNPIMDMHRSSRPRDGVFRSRPQADGTVPIVAVHSIDLI